MNGRGLWLVAGAGALAAALAKRKLDVLTLTDQLDAQLPAHLAQWARELAAAATSAPPAAPVDGWPGVASAPSEVAPLRWGKFVAAIMDRETQGGTSRYLSRRGPTGTGDAGHGLGLMQLDDRAHPGLLELPELWQDPAWNIPRGAGELAALFRRTRAELELDERLQRAADAYNAGPRALTAADPDALTWGEDYGTDVLRRLAQWETTTA